MIDVVLVIILLIFVIFLIVIPVSVNMFKELIWQDIKQRLQRENYHAQLRANYKKK